MRLTFGISVEDYKYIKSIVKIPAPADYIIFWHHVMLQPFSKISEELNLSEEETVRISNTTVTRINKQLAPQSGPARKQGTLKIKGFDYQGPRMTHDKALERIRNVLQNELTQKQKEAVIGYFIEKKNIQTMAEENGVNKSTISRNLSRGVRKIQKFLKY